MFGRWLQWHAARAVPPSQDGGGNGHLITLVKVVKTYHSAAGAVQALKGVDLEVDRGEFVAASTSLPARRSRGWPIRPPGRLRPPT